VVVVDPSVVGEVMVVAEEEEEEEAVDEASQMKGRLPK
jgi:hypothetical protein